MGNQPGQHTQSFYETINMNEPKNYIEFKKKYISCFTKNQHECKTSGTCVYQDNRCMTAEYATDNIGYLYNSTSYKNIRNANATSDNFLYIIDMLLSRPQIYRFLALVDNFKYANGTIGSIAGWVSGLDPEIVIEIRKASKILETLVYTLYIQPSVGLFYQHGVYTKFDYEHRKNILIRSEVDAVFEVFRKAAYTTFAESVDAILLSLGVSHTVRYAFKAKISKLVLEQIGGIDTDPEYITSIIQPTIARFTSYGVLQKEGLRNFQYTMNAELNEILSD